MKTHKRKLPVLILLAIFCFTLLHLTACKDGKQPDNPDQPGVSQTDYGIDNVYYAKEDGREYLFTITGNSFLISGFNGEQTGKFVYADGNLTLTFKTGDDTQASAVLENGVLKLTYNGGTYRMVPRTYYTVSFEVGGGSAVAAQKVLNGATATKPADPTRTGMRSSDGMPIRSTRLHLPSIPSPSARIPRSMPALSSTRQADRSTRFPLPATVPFTIRSGQSTELFISSPPR
ncbi:MAG: InlB B-repeat-containing protein [Oscillospiraceae bacterium]|nr:MAG: InlB B-repeat-containing protein [Oscillospiraceae bacterium]